MKPQERDWSLFLGKVTVTLQEERIWVDRFQLCHPVSDHREVSAHTGHFHLPFQDGLSVFELLLSSRGAGLCGPCQQGPHIRWLPGGGDQWGPPGADSREEEEPQAGACVYLAPTCTVASGCLCPWLQASAPLHLIYSMVSPLGLSHSPHFRPFRE